MRRTSNAGFLISSCRFAVVKDNHFVDWDHQRWQTSIEDNVLTLTLSLEFNDEKEARVLATAAACSELNERNMEIDALNKDINKLVNQEHEVFFPISQQHTNTYALPPRRMLIRQKLLVVKLGFYWLLKTTTCVAPKSFRALKSSTASSTRFVRTGICFRHSSGFKG